MEQEDKHVSYQDGKTIAKTLTERKWRLEHPDHKSDSYYRLNTADHVSLFRLRTGYNRVTAHHYNKMKIGQTEMCPCDTAPMDTAHLLQDCPLQDIPRLAAWPEETHLREKLYGDLVALRKTASFVRATGVDV